MSHLKVANLHGMAREGVDRVLEMGRPRDVPLNMYSERQLVHEIGYGLRQRDFWTGFEQRYAGPRDKKKETVADILAFPRAVPRKEWCLWLEVKSTGLTDDRRRDNALSTLGWEHDFEKLRGLDNRVWATTHYGYWVWMFLFDTYRDAIYDRFGRSSEWGQRTSLSRMAEVVGRLDGNPVTLGRVLLDIEKESAESTCSCIQMLKDGRVEYSTLLVTVRPKRRGSHRRHYSVAAA